MPDPIIKMRDVRKAFGTNQVLDGFELNVDPHEIFVLLGGSGAGKSVTLKHIIGLIRPDAGQITVMDRDVDSLSQEALMELRKKIGYLFQSGGLLNSLSVFENIALPLREHTPLSDGEIRDRVMDRLEIVGLASFSDVMPEVLSGGMRKRVSLARVVVQEPEIILYDEPTHGLDPIMAGRINDLILDLNQRFNTTSVVVTHDMAGAMEVADRLGLIHEGRMIETGDPDSFFNSETPLVKQFVRGEPDAADEAARLMNQIDEPTTHE